MLARAALAPVLALLLSLPSPWTAAAQQPRVSPFLPAGHWSVDAARRLHGLGLTPAGYDPGTELQYAHEMVAAFQAAADRSSLAAGWLARLEQEIGGADELVRLVAGDGLGTRTRVSVGAAALEGRMLSGTGVLADGDWTGPTPLPDARGATAALDHGGRYGRIAYGLAAAVPPGTRPVLRAGYGALAVRHLGLWAGVRPGAFRAGPGSSVVLTTLQPGPGVGVQLTGPVRLPGHLAALGAVRFSTDATRAGRNYQYDHPWIWTMRGMLEPHPRLQVGVNRAVMLGGGDRDISLRDLAYILIGKHTATLDNQVVAVTVRYRLPTEALLPLVTYLEWGAEDSAGAWRDVPGVMAGIEIPALPLVPAAAVGVSRTRFARSCCGNPSWYTNHAFRDGWADDRRSLGHPLGGHGREWLAYGRADLLEARLQLEGRVFTRTREEENLFAPDRQGRSTGGAIGVLLFLAPGWQAQLDFDGEQAASRAWRQLSLRAVLRATL